MVVHDLFNGHSISHHDMNNPIKQYQKELENKNSLAVEIDEMKKWVQIVLPVMLFATVLYFCVFAVVFYQSEQTAALLGSGMTVVLDAGHGGEDGGATGVSGTSEAALNLEISLRVRDLLRSARSARTGVQ